MPDATATITKPCPCCDEDIVMTIGLDVLLSCALPPSPPPPPPPPSFTPILLDFGNTPTQSGYTGFPWAAYAASPGYGYTSASPSFPNLDRGSAAVPANPDFFRDGTCNFDFASPQSFKFSGLTPSTSYDVRGYFYDATFSSNGTYTFRDKATPANTTAPVVGASPGVGVLTITANGSGEIEIEWFNAPGNYSFANGLEIALTGQLPTALS
jgi:hypothetical protein